MANIVLTNQIFYKNGQGGVSGVVGYESKSNRVVRYTMQSPPSGASSIDLSFTGNYWTEYGVLPETLYFYIGTDPESHANAGEDFERTGELERKVKTYDYSGSADILLMPNTTYYVWVFPSSTVFGWLYWSKNLGDATVETKGGAVSTVEPVSVVLGNSVEVSVTRHVQTYTHTIKFELGWASGTICEKSENTKILWTPPIDLAWEIVNSDRANATIVVETYNGDQLVGSTSDVEFELIVPDAIVPSVYFSWSDLSTAQDAFNALAKGVSFLQIDIDAEGEYGSNIVETETTLDGRLYYGGLVDVSGDVPLTVKVTDSRGRTSISTQTLFIYEYATPTISVSASRSNEDGSSNETGEFAVVKLKTIVHDVNDKNEANIVLSYGGTSEEIPVLVGEKETTKIIPAPSVSPLYISAIVYDKIKESSVANMTLSIGYATMDFFSGGKGIAFGTTATKEGFTCSMDTDFTGHAVTGLANPKEDTDAVNKNYVDDAIKSAVDNISPGAAPESVNVEANAAVPVSIEEGELYHICFLLDGGSKTGDIFLKANEKNASYSAYTFAGSSANFTDGQISYAGSSLSSVFTATAQVHNGQLIVSGKDIRGNGTGTGNSLLVWNNMSSVSSLTFSRSGSLMLIGAGTKGEKGDPGKDGATGPQGPQGEKGEMFGNSVKNFGAVGDGVADDSDAIQAALDAGGVVYFPPGRYKVTKPLTAYAPCTIKMDGAYPSAYPDGIYEGGYACETGDHPTDGAYSHFGARIETYAGGVGMTIGDSVIVDGLNIRAMAGFSGTVLRYDGAKGVRSYPSITRLSHIRISNQVTDYLENGTRTALAPECMFDFHPYGNYGVIVDDVIIGSNHTRQLATYGFRTQLTQWANTVRISNVNVEMFANYPFYIKGNTPDPYVAGNTLYAGNWVLRNICIQAYKLAEDAENTWQATSIPYKHQILFYLEGMTGTYITGCKVWDVENATVAVDVARVVNMRKTTAIGNDDFINAIDMLLTAQFEEANQLNLASLDVSVAANDDGTGNVVTMKDGKKNTKTFTIPSAVLTDEQIGTAVGDWMADNAAPVEQIGKNKLNPADCFDGDINGSYGHEQESIYAWVSGFIPCVYGDQVRVYETVTIKSSGDKTYRQRTLSYIYEYDINKGYIGRVSTFTGNIYTPSGENVAYFRIQFSGKNSNFPTLFDDRDKCMATVNNADSTLEPYAKELVGGIGQYLVLASPNGTKYTLSVADDGTVSAVPV